MNRKIQISLDAIEAVFFEEFARRKGLKLHALVKMALFQYAERFPKKGLEMNLPETSKTIANQAQQGH